MLFTLLHISVKLNVYDNSSREMLLLFIFIVIAVRFLFVSQDVTESQMTETRSGAVQSADKPCTE